MPDAQKTSVPDSNPNPFSPPQLGGSDSDPLTELLRSLKIAFDPDVELDLASIFPKSSGWGAKGDIKRKAKLIQNCSPTLKRMLMEGEVVKYVALGIQAKFVEQYFMGAIWANAINQTVFVLTNLRVIMLHSNSKGMPKGQAWSIYYDQIEKFKRGGLVSSKLFLKDKSKFTYTGFKGLDKKSIPVALEDAKRLYSELGFSPASTQSRENLCSHCYQVVPRGSFQCARCGQKFWQPHELALRSLFFPSWGDFLMGHTVVGVAELFGTLVAWCIGLVSIGAFLARPNDPGPLIVAVLVIGMAHIGDAIVTYLVAKKGLNAKGRPGQVPHANTAGAGS